MLTEGLADKAFFRALIEAHQLPKFDFPWPVANDDDCSPGAKKLHSRDQFGNMLKALDAYLTQRPELRDQLKGVLIVTDARDDPDDSFRYVCQQVSKVRRFGIPAAPLEVAESADQRPALAIMLLPDVGDGSLETVCIDEMRAQMPQVFDAMKTYLGTEPIKALTWRAEKRDKARLHCIIAATNENDPTKSLQYAFSRSHGNPIIDAEADCFENLFQNIKNFCEAVDAI